METSYPVFEPGQVLTSTQLNDLATYLEEQERLTRNKLVGIGIGCGFHVRLESNGKKVVISQGAAVTSEGHLIVDEERVLDRYREYQEPVATTEEAPASARGQYSFFRDDAGDPIDLWELLPPGFKPAQGELPPTALSRQFLHNKVVLLFLECKLESLKNCDINDCSDKGAELEFTLRRLLVTEADAKSLLEREAGIANRPVDRHLHGGFDLEFPQISKINPGAHEIATFQDLHDRILAIADENDGLVDNLATSFEVYKYLLADMYPESDFPDGPFAGGHYFKNVVRQIQQNIVLVQHAYDYFHDLVQAYNEFLRAAIAFEAECCPHPGRFPKHVFLGKAVERPKAFVPNLATSAALAAFNPVSADTGLGPSPKPERFRHHFVPSMALGDGRRRFDEVRSLHYRMYLLAYRYSTKDLFASDVRITPSKEGDYSLSEKSVPFYYGFEWGDDLHRNWSYRKTATNRLDDVHSYQFTDEASHPLKARQDDHNFYRVEGVVGKKLGEAMREVIRQKRELGLSFALEPVYVGLSVNGDDGTKARNREAIMESNSALRRLIECRLSDLDAFFVVLVTTIFRFAQSTIRHVAMEEPVKLIAVERTPKRVKAKRSSTRASGTELRIDPALLRGLSRVRGTGVVRVEDTKFREFYRKEYTPLTITNDAIKSDDPKKSVGTFYKETMNVEGGELLERVKKTAKTLGAEYETEEAVKSLYANVVLLDKTESLVESISKPSLADVNPDDIDRRMLDAAAAYEAYVDQLANSELDIKTEAGRAKLDVVKTYGTFVGTGMQSVVRNLFKEFTSIRERMVAELRLPGYAKKHPGLEHKCGVPVGGTLVLLYTHRKLLRATHKTHAKTYARVIKSTASRYKVATTLTAVKAVDKVVVATPKGEPLDDFVVLADFCLPYKCCETDCSDIELADKEPQVDDRPAVIFGTTFASTRRGVERLPRATIVVKNVKTDKEKEIEASDARYDISVDPGNYLLTANYKNFKSQPRAVIAKPGGEYQIDLTVIFSE